MSTRRYKLKFSKKNKNNKTNKNKTGKKWTTAIAAANITLKKTSLI